jgi:hypothetical protein
MLTIFERAPDRFNLAEIAEHIDGNDVGSGRSRRRFCRPAFDRSRRDHRKPVEYVRLFPAQSDLCKQMSTKSNDNATFGGAVSRERRAKDCHLASG